MTSLGFEGHCKFEWLTSSANLVSKPYGEPKLTVLFVQDWTLVYGKSGFELFCHFGLGVRGEPSFCKPLQI